MPNAITYACATMFEVRVFFTDLGLFACGMAFDFLSVLVAWRVCYLNRATVFFKKGVGTLIVFK